MSNNEWLNMATAPLDGTVIIGVSGQSVFACRHWTQEQIAEDEGGDPQDYHAGWYDCDDPGCERFPTGWVAKPTNPTE